MIKRAFFKKTRADSRSQSQSASANEFAKGLPAILYGEAGASALILFLLSPQVPGRLLLGWLGVQIVTISARAVHLDLFKRSDTPGKHYTGFVVGMAMCGFCWGALATLLPWAAEAETRIFLVLCVAGFGTAVLHHFSLLPRGARAFVMLALLPLSIALAASGDGMSYVLSGIVAALSTAMWLSIDVSVRTRERPGREEDDLSLRFGPRMGELPDGTLGHPYQKSRRPSGGGAASDRAVEIEQCLDAAQGDRRVHKPGHARGDFQRRSARLVADLTIGLDEGNWDRVTRSAILLKVLSAQEGATDLAAVAARIESCAETRSLGQARACLFTLYQEQTDASLRLRRNK